MSRSPARFAFPAAVLLLAAGGCSSAATTSAATPPTTPTTSSTASPATPSASPQIVISNFAYTPEDLTVHPGQRVTVVNHDSVAHTVTANPGGPFDTGPIQPGASATFTAPATTGTYPYVCTIHASMHGTLTIK